MSENYKEKKPEEFKDEYIEFTPDILPNSAEFHEKDFEYWKNIERLKWKQIIWLSSGSFAWSVSYNSTWVKTVSWVWFTPKMIKISACVAGTNTGFSDWYYFNGWVNCRYVYYTGSNASIWTVGYSAYCQSSGNASLTTTITPTSDWFTINVVNVSAWQITLLFECFG